jgi:hypothetical protein
MMTHGPANIDVYKLSRDDRGSDRVPRSILRQRDSCDANNRFSLIHQHLKCSDAVNRSTLQYQFLAPLFCTVNLSPDKTTKQFFPPVFCAVNVRPDKTTKQCLPTVVLHCKSAFR